MKLTAILLFTACLQVSARGYGQNITLKAEQASLQTVMQQIKDQTGYSFFYNAEWLEKSQPVTANLKDVPLNEALDLLFKNQPVSYSVIDNTIVLKLKNLSSSVTSSSEIPPPVDIHGRVTDSLGNPLAGASVTVKGSSKGTATNNNGEFVLTDVNENSTLVISYTGFTNKQVKVNNNSSINIFLIKSHDPLDEVQVIAYGTTTRRLNTGDVSTVKSEVIEQQPVFNTLAALEGRVAGLSIIQQTGVPGGAFFVQIRGQNSLSNGNNPLYIVDGVPFPSTSISSNYSGYAILGGSPFNAIDPSDIESVEVLKDADATAIYGSRGSNGVILITTKKGKSGKTVFNASTYFGGGQVARTMNLLTTQPYLQMRHEAFANDGASPDLANGDYDLLLWDTTRYTDWQKTLIGSTANIADVQASLSGGNANTNFLVGGGYHQEGSVFPGSFADKRESFHFNLGHQSLNQRFNMNLSVGYSLENNNTPATDFTNMALTLAPDAPPVYDSTGKLNWPPGFNNPYSYLLQTYKASTQSLIGDLLLDYLVLPGLHLKANLGYTNMQNSEHQISPITSFNPIYGATSGNTTTTSGDLKTWIAEPQITYDRNFNFGKLNIVFGATFQEDDRNSLALDGEGYPSDLLLNNLASASTVNVYDQTNTQYKYEGFFGRINYNWNDKFIFNLTGRRDGSSRFGPGKQFANFGAIGGAYIFSAEKWVHENFSFLSFGKIRSSYGTTGNDQIGDYQFYSTYSATRYPYNGTSGLLANHLYNPNYGWETNAKWEIAIELGFLRDRILTSVNYYNNRSSNQLVADPLPEITGFGSIQNNLPAIVQNSGIELEINSVNIRTSQFTWKTSFNMTFPRNELVSFPNLKGSAYQYRYAMGKPLSTQFLFHYTGVDSKTGLYQFEDVNQDGQVTYPADLTSNKTVAQKYYGGLLNSFQYKNWKLDIFFQFVKQTGFNYLYNSYTAPGMLGNQPTLVMKRWQKSGDVTNIQQFSQAYGDAYNAYSNVGYSDNAISDASFIRLKNISLSYLFHFDKVTKGSSANCRLFIQGQNLITISHYLGLDPENYSSSVLPPLKVITAGLQFTF